MGSYFMYQKFLAARTGLLEELSRKLRNCVIYDGQMRQYGQPDTQPHKTCGFAIYVIIKPNISNAKSYRGTVNIPHSSDQYTDAL